MIQRDKYNAKKTVRERVLEVVCGNKGNIYFLSESVRL